MTLLSVVIAYLILRWWGSAKPLHNDVWYFRWCDWLAGQSTLQRLPITAVVLSIAGPALALVVLLILATSLWYWSQLLIAVPVLLYSVGRGKYAGFIMRYARARQQRDWASALACFESLAAPGEGEHGLGQDDWAGLDQRMLTQVSYRGFERIFAVLFWFILLGPVGALIYRLSALYLLQTESGRGENRDYARQWLWLLEWPAARVLGLSFALTGNFVGCIHSWRHHLWATEYDTGEVIEQYLLGALQVDEGITPSAETTENEFRAILALFSRTLIFWLCVLAVVTVVL